MYINKRSNLPKEQANKDYSMYVFIYYTNNKRFCLGYYDFVNCLWMDSDGMVISEDFLWTYLPIKQMKAFLRSTQERNDELY